VVISESKNIAQIISFLKVYLGMTTFIYLNNLNLIWIIMYEMKNLSVLHVYSCELYTHNVKINQARIQSGVVGANAPLVGRFI